MGQLVAYVCLFLASVVYLLFLSDGEYRCVMSIASFVNLFNAITSLMITRNIFLGLSPFAFLMIQTTCVEATYDIFVNLPTQVLFSKMIPSTIEASLFSIQAGIINFGNFVLAKQLGNFVNLFVGVDKDNLEDLWKLFAV